MSEKIGSLGPRLPIPIFVLPSQHDRYMLYDIDIVSWLRREHRILGCLTGTLPQVPQQNVFLGLPLELMPEEAKLLVEKDVAILVEDASRHRALQSHHSIDTQTYKDMLYARGMEAAQTETQRRKQIKEKALAKVRATKTQHRESMQETLRSFESKEDPAEGLFMPSRGDSPIQTDAATVDSANEPWRITPCTSNLLLPQTVTASTSSFRQISAPSFAVYKHLNELGYYLSPGLRFGCQFMAYPGDPLRYHSHFLAVGMDWDEEIDLLDLLGGGRLGTGVKKSFLIGGSDPQSTALSPAVRTFCLEWGGM